MLHREALLEKTSGLSQSLISTTYMGWFPQEDPHLAGMRIEGDNARGCRQGQIWPQGGAPSLFHSGALGPNCPSPLQHQPK